MNFKTMLIVPDKYKKFFSASSGNAIGIQGYHVLMTSPFTYENLDKPLEMINSMLLTAELAALLWLRFNGSISLITDKIGFDYIKGLLRQAIYLFYVFRKRNAR